jgi:hypothetical protein
MITLEEAMVLLCVRMNPNKNKTELLTLLSETYRISPNRRELSMLVDKLNASGLVGNWQKLPRTYFISHEGGDELFAFGKMVERFTELQNEANKRTDAIKNSDEFKRWLSGQ